MLESRRHFRLRQPMDIRWNVNNADLSGDGTILNISTSGVLMQTDKVFQISDPCVMSIEVQGEETPFTIKEGKVVWFKRIHTPQQRYQCGVEFVKGSGFDKQLNSWLDEKVVKLSEASSASILNNYVVQ